MELVPYGKALTSNQTYPEINFNSVYQNLSVDFSAIVSRAPDSSLLTDFGLSIFEPKDLYNDFRAKLAYQIQSELERTILHYSCRNKKNNTKHKHLPCRWCRTKLRCNRNFSQKWYF